MYVHVHTYVPIQPPCTHRVYTPICSMAQHLSHHVGSMAKGSKGGPNGVIWGQSMGVPPSHDMPWVMTQGHDVHFMALYVHKWGHYHDLKTIWCTRPNSFKVRHAPGPLSRGVRFIAYMVPNIYTLWDPPEPPI